MTDKWYKDEMSEKERWRSILGYRDYFLQMSDWTQLNDVPLNDAKKTAWSIYRQALRDITDIFVNASDVVFPEIPNG